MKNAVMIHDLSPPQDKLLDELTGGLKKATKELPCKLFYDNRGSELFSEICRLSEYYPTRTEKGILEENIDEIVSLVGRRCMLIEYGSGTSEKTEILLKHLPELVAYVPIDISKECLEQSATRMAGIAPGLDVIAVCTDYNHDFDLPSKSKPTSHRTVYFPGSTIGNFHPHEAIDFLKRVAEQCGPDGHLLIGVDLKKDPEVLHRAYNDGAGVTASFNINVLVRMNREFGSDFEIDGFHHRAFYNEALGRIEMHLVSQREQTVHLDGVSVRFNEGESIWTESSYKYTLEEFERLALRAGFKVKKVWTDTDRLFSLQYLTP